MQSAGGRQEISHAYLMMAASLALISCVCVCVCVCVRVCVFVYINVHERTYTNVYIKRHVSRVSLSCFLGGASRPFSIRRASRDCVHTQSDRIRETFGASLVRMFCQEATSFSSQGCVPAVARLIWQRRFGAYEVTPALSRATTLVTGRSLPAPDTSVRNVAKSVCALYRGRVLASVIFPSTLLDRRIN